MVRMVRCYVGMPVSLVCCSYIMRGMHGMHGMRGTLVCLLISQVSKGLGHLSDSVKTVSPHY